MSMMMPPDPAAAGGLPMPPGGVPPPAPGGEGMDAIMAALGGGGAPPMDAGAGAAPPIDPSMMGAPPPDMGQDLGGAAPEDPMAGLPPDPSAIPPELGEAAMAGDELGNMGPVEHIRAAMKHLMLAMAGDQDDERGAGVMKGMGALQAILGGEQKKQALMGPGPVSGG